MKESQYQTKIIKKLEAIFPGCIILRNDPSWIQGVPDIVILYQGFWGALEVKVSLSSDIQPNQKYYVEKMDDMSFAAFICPENEQDILNDLQNTFESFQQARLSESQ